MHRTLGAAILILAGILTAPVYPAQANQPIPLKSSRDHFPFEGSWQRFVSGLREAEQFRLDSLKPDEKLTAGSLAASLSELIIHFHRTASPALQQESRPDLSAFNLDEPMVLRAFSDNSREIGKVTGFESFEGKWFGLWDIWPVDHDWSAVWKQEPPVSMEYPGMDIDVHHLQYAWIGDGFGWNVLSTPGDSGMGQVILGTVYHVRDMDPQQVYNHRPHVGIKPGPDQLIWITRNEVFFEEMIPGDSPLPDDDTYVITGFFHHILDGRADFRETTGFQAVYSRSPDQRKAFHKFDLTPLSMD